MVLKFTLLISLKYHIKENFKDFLFTKSVQKSLFLSLKSFQGQKGQDMNTVLSAEFPSNIAFKNRVYYSMFYEKDSDSYWFRFHFIIKELIRSWVFIMKSFWQKQKPFKYTDYQFNIWVLWKMYIFHCLLLCNHDFSKRRTTWSTLRKRLTPVVTLRSGVYWSVKILPKKNLYDTIKLQLMSTSSSSWKENRKGHGSKYLIIKCDKDLIRVIFQECLRTGLWLLYAPDSSNI